jgi:hypothetical protein
MADKILSIGLGANTSGLKKDMDNAAAIVKNAGQQMGDAVVQSSDKMSSSSKRAGENLQSAYRAAAREAREAAIQFGETSDRFIVAAQTAGELKDRLDLTNQTIKAFSNDAPVLTATVGVIQGMAGAFSAAQGAAALFGSDSKALEETMVKLQGALALTTGLQGMKGLGDSLQTLGTTLSAKVIPQFTGLFSLIAANPITATVIAITALGAAYIALSDSTDHARQSQASYDFELASASATVADRVRLVTEQNVKLQNVLKAKQSGVNESAIEAEILKSQIDSKQAILDKEKDALKLKAAGNAEESEANFYASGKVIQLEGELTLLKQLYDETKKKSDLEASINQKAANKITSSKPQMSLFQDKPLEKFSGPKDTVKWDDVIAPFMQLNKIEFDKPIGKLEALKNKMKEMGAVMAQLAERTFVNFATSLGKALGGEKMDLGNGIKSAIGELCSMLATAAAALGTFYFSVGDIPQGVAAYAAAAALGIAAGVLSASSSTPSSSGVSASSTTNAGTFGNGGMNSNFGVLQVGGEIRGNNLLVSVNRSGYERGRVR